MTLEAAVIPDILYLFGQGKFVFINDKTENFQKLWQL